MLKNNQQKYDNQNRRSATLPPIGRFSTPMTKPRFIDPDKQRMGVQRQIVLKGRYHLERMHRYNTVIA